MTDVRKHLEAPTENEQLFGGIFKVYTYYSFYYFLWVAVTVWRCLGSRSEWRHSCLRSLSSELKSFSFIWNELGVSDYLPDRVELYFINPDFCREASLLPHIRVCVLKQTHTEVWTSTGSKQKLSRFDLCAPYLSLLWWILYMIVWRKDTWPAASLQKFLFVFYQLETLEKLCSTVFKRFFRNMYSMFYFFIGINRTWHLLHLLAVGEETCLFHWLHNTLKTVSKTLFAAG